MRRVVVTEAGNGIGRRVAEALRADPEVESVRSVTTRTDDRHESGEDVDHVPLVPDHRPFVEYLQKERIDTVVQSVLTPDRSGRGNRSGEADVITTMCLGAAVCHESSGIRNWVVLSSSSVYPIGSRASLLQREDQALAHEEGAIEGSIIEAEEYARDVAIRNLHINVAILRLQQLAGPRLAGPLSEMLTNGPVPSPLGFDSAIQLLHEDDAAGAVAFAVRRELAGLYNVASEGTVRWHDAVRISGSESVPVLPLGAGALEPLLRKLRVPCVPAELLDLLRFGHALDTRKFTLAGWKPKYDQQGCLESIRTGSDRSWRPTESHVESRRA